MLKKCISVIIFLSFFGLKSSCFANDLAERLAIKVAFLNSAKEVTGKIKYAEADSLLQFLDKNSVLAAPSKEGIILLQNGKSENWFAVVPVLNSDSGISQRWDGIFLMKNAAGNFLPEIRAMVLRNNIAYSSTGKAIMFLHEGYHAYLFLQNPYAGHQSDKDYCYEEVWVHTFQNKVMSLLGGELYQKILADEVTRISKNAKISKDGYHLSGRIEYDERLAVAFGNPVSQEEKDFIQSGVWINAVFVFLDKNFKENATDKKALFLRMLYKESGIS